MTGRGEDFTTGSLLDYDYSNPKANQQVELAEILKVEQNQKF